MRSLAISESKDRFARASSCAAGLSSMREVEHDRNAYCMPTIVLPAAFPLIVLAGLIPERAMLLLPHLFMGFPKKMHILPNHLEAAIFTELPVGSNDIVAFFVLNDLPFLV